MEKVPNFDAVVIAAGMAGMCRLFRLREQGSHLQGIETDAWPSFLFDGAAAAKARELT